MSTIGIRLRQERVRVGLTQRQLGLLGGVAANTQGFYEKDKRSPAPITFPGSWQQVLT